MPGVVKIIDGKKHCATCKRMLPIEQFLVNKKYRSGYDYACVRCLGLWQNYRISSLEYDMMFESQGGLCAICQQPPSGKVSLVVDHDHTTLKIRALLCNGCNSGIGHFGEDVGRMLAAIKYLEKHQRAQSLSLDVSVSQ